MQRCYLHNVKRKEEKKMKNHSTKKLKNNIRWNIALVYYDIRWGLFKPGKWGRSEVFR